MKWFLCVVGVILVLGGGVFSLQGMSVLPSRVMYGKPEWVLIGAAMVVVGVAITVFVNRRGARA
jgi:hypothetical protein